MNKFQIILGISQPSHQFYNIFQTQYSSITIDLFNIGPTLLVIHIFLRLSSDSISVYYMNSHFSRQEKGRIGFEM